MPNATLTACHRTHRTRARSDSVACTSMRAETWRQLARFTRRHRRPADAFPASPFQIARMPYTMFGFEADMFVRLVYLISCFLPPQPTSKETYNHPRNDACLATQGPCTAHMPLLNSASFAEPFATTRTRFMDRVSQLFVNLHRTKGGQHPAPTAEVGRVSGLALFSDPTTCPYLCQHHPGPQQTIAQRFGNGDTNRGPRRITLYHQSV
ncbi:hypothetical protein LX36DRAFT_300905 [Colletotrichum falcatum]|nr:hypothetical protein LX36DRAFT_300905 [Colletotrichum falcatum]